MDAAALKKQLELAVQQGKDAEAKNVVLEAKAEKLEVEQKSLLVKFEAMSKTIEDGGGSTKALDALGLTIKELQDECSDLRLKQKTPLTAVTDEDQKKALDAVAHQAVAVFVKQKQSEDGVKADDLHKFVHGYAVDKFKTLNISNPETGGLAIAEVLARDVMDYAREFSPILGLVGRKPAMTRAYRQLIKVSFPTVRKGSENVAGLTVPSGIANTDTQTYVEVISHGFKVSAEPRVTDEAMSAPDIDIYADLLSSMGEEIGIYLADQLLYGDGGTQEARGILTTRLDITNTTGESWKPTLGAGRRDSDTFPTYATGVSGAIAATDALMVDFVIKSMAKLPSRYRKNAKWHMNENTKTLFELVRNANGDPIFRADYRTGEFVLNGKPVVIDDTLPDVAADSAFAIYGDLSRAVAINDGAINKMLINPYIIRGCTVVEYDKEMFEMIQRSDAIMVMVATTNGL